MATPLGRMRDAAFEKAVGSMIHDAKAGLASIAEAADGESADGGAGSSEEPVALQ